MRKKSLPFKVLFIFLLFGAGVNPIDFSIVNDFNLVNYRKNVIRNSECLEPFFLKLLKLKKEKNTTLSIVHIGDSHVQADFFTGQIRTNFQKDFGNSGRGLIVPARVAKTNEPENFFSSSSSVWDSKRIVFPDQPLPIGIGGITVSTSDSTARLNITTKEAQYAFNKITVFFQKDLSSYHLAVKDSLNRSIAFIGPYTPEPFKNTSAVILPFNTNSISFQVFKALTKQKRITIYGINLENNKPGVLYHAIGVNGAKYKHYLAAEDFVNQTPVLHPDLFVISLGTNEALDFPYRDPDFTAQVENLIKILKTKNPGSDFILITPPGSYQKKNKKNIGVEETRNKLIEFALNNHLAYFDLYDAGGENYFAKQWNKKELLRKDGVHFTKEGYELQGNMFYLAFINAFNDYVIH